MKKTKTQFVCSQCGCTFSKWMGRCTDCNAWNSINEEEVADSKNYTPNQSNKATAEPLTEVKFTQEKRIFTGIGELDRVLGGGIVPGALMLLSGDPGIGKSTLLLQALHKLATKGHKILYASGEESAMQIKLRAERVGCVHSAIHITNETNALAIADLAKHLKPTVLVIDSIQTMMHPDFPSSPGAVTQIRECTNVFLEMSKGQGIATWIIGHVTKDGQVAGPRVLEHLVDTVMYLEGDSTSGHRILRSIKNRFGSTGEIGIFAMHGLGLAEVSNPSELFLEQRNSKVEGTAVTVSLEGSRPLLLELQTLLVKTTYPTPRRVVTGLDFNRFTILTAVLEKRAGLYLSTYDIYATVAGGMKLIEPTTDLALAAALASSVQASPYPARFAYFGEVGLAGEVRMVPNAVLRIQEAQKLGFDRVYFPARNYKTEKTAIDELVARSAHDIQLCPIEHVSEVVRMKY